MNTTLNRYLYASLFTLSLYLIGCGSSSNDVAGIDGSGAPVASSNGTIDGFGSVIVNDIRYDSAKANIMINGQTASEDDLHIGYRVKITGTHGDKDSGVANTIEFRPDLIGEITDINTTLNQLVVLGQTVQINNATIFDNAITPNNLQGLAITERVLISGQTDINGVITATRIEPSTQNLQLGGMIQALNEANHTFTLRGISVNYSMATLIHINNNHLENGMNISIQGSLNNNSIFEAETIYGVNENFEGGVEKAEVEGFITNFTSTTDLTVNGVQCSTTTQTDYEHGTIDNLVLGAAVEISGSVSNSNVLQARHIEFNRRASNHIQGQVSEITLDTSGAIVIGSFSVDTTNIITTSSTRYEDKSDNQVRRFNLASIQIGDFVDVSGYNNDGNFIAIKIERKHFDNNEDTELHIEGIVSSVGIDSIVILGKEITLSDSTEIEGTGDAQLTKAEFLAIALNQQIKIEGILRDGVITATNIEIEEHEMEELH